MKNMLLATIATERARLFSHLLNLSEAALTTAPVFPESGWTAADLLLHIGEWDRYHGAAAYKALMGSASPQPRPENATLRERTLPLAQTVEHCIAARHYFLDALELATEAELEQHPDVITLAERRATHDAEHTAHLKAWREALEAQPVGPRSILIAALEAAWLDWDLNAALTTPDQAVCGTWTLKDTTAHLADWCNRRADDIREVLGDVPRHPQLAIDRETFNAQRHTARTADSWESVYDDLDVARVEMMAIVRRADLTPTVYAHLHAEITHSMNHAATLRQQSAQG